VWKALVTQMDGCKKDKSKWSKTTKDRAKTKGGKGAFEEGRVVRLGSKSGAISPKKGEAEKKGDHISQNEQRTQARGKPLAG